MVSRRIQRTIHSYRHRPAKIRPVPAAVNSATALLASHWQFAKRRDHFPSFTVLTVSTPTPVQLTTTGVPAGSAYSTLGASSRKALIKVTPPLGQYTPGVSRPSPSQSPASG